MAALCLILMRLINTYMNKTNFISIRNTQAHKQQLMNEAKQANTTISKLILDSINKAKDETAKTYKEFRLSSNQLDKAIKDEEKANKVRGVVV